MARALMAVCGAVALATMAGCGTSKEGAVPAPVENETMFNASDAYERFMGRWSRQVAPDLVRFLGLSSGDIVLDVGAGTGALAAAVLAAAPTSRVTGIDPSEAYVRQAAAVLDPARSTFEVGDAQQMRFADGSFDRTASLLVVNFIPDPGKALDEMVRVTKPGGVVAAAVWDYGQGMEMLRTFWDEAVAFDPTVDPRDERHMPLCRPGELAALWRAHRLTDVEEVPLVIETVFGSFDDYWEPFLEGQGPAGAYVASLPADRQQALASRLRARLLAGGGDGPITLHARAWAVRGTVPRR
jgi:SAM-dependent methyltransferase